MYQNKLNELRISKGLSQKDLAEVFDTTQQTISRWEQGIHLPPISKMIQLETFFNVDKEDIFFEVFNTNKELKV